MDGIESVLQRSPQVPSQGFPPLTPQNPSAY